MKVKVNIKKTDINYPTLGKYNGKVMTVTAKKYIQVGTRTEAYYHLDGATAPTGISYSFAQEHIKLM